MFRIDGGKTNTYCDGLSRRNFVQLGVAGMASVPLSGVLRAQAATAERHGTSTRDRSVIMIWLDGGPSHLDLYDLKPQAAAEVRGIWHPISTNVPGIEISELFPRQAQVADKFSIVRSLYHDTGDHFTGGHYMLTGRGGVSGGATAGRNPSIGSMITKAIGARRPGMPSYVSVPVASSIGLRPGYFGGNYLGFQHNPFETDGDPNKDDFSVKNVKLPDGLSVGRLNDRRGLLASVDRMRRSIDASGEFDSLDTFQRQAYDFVSGPEAREAFDLTKEDDKLRERYGRNTWGQSTLLARRLVEAGSRFVTVHCGGWDHHWNLESGMNNYLPQVDALVAGLLTDLDERGMWDDTLVMVCGEFSRTPRMNDGGNGGPPGSMGTPGRDHWGSAMFCVMGGGGVRGGVVVGATDAKGERPAERPVTCGDIHATMLHVMGIDQDLSFIDHAGRPTPAIEKGSVIHELV
ncbi:MAG: DUF1501 domain-containing protein [Planctomycetales bacterium]|nr:DUF1501 domain-containing protein [Planctomycetales bacterium]